MPDKNLIGLRKFVAPEFVFGVGARSQVARCVRNFGARKVLVVSDSGVERAGWTRDVTETLDRDGIAYVIFTGVTPNPKASEVHAGVEVYRANGCDMLVAVGGGSVIDCAKAIGIVASNHRDILAFEGVDLIASPMPPLVCIPTTGGTSADVSQFCIITHTAERRKIAIISKAVVPDVSLIDPQTLLTMDPFLAACTGMDALTHGIEAFVSNAASPLSDLHALEGIRLISANLEESLRQPSDLALRERVMRGSLQAGLAFSNASLGSVHAMAHSLGGYKDLAHGECNSLLLPYVTEFNFDAVPDRFIQIGEAMGLDLRGLTTAERRVALVARLRSLLRSVGIDAGLRARGIVTPDVRTLAENAMNDACMVTNPREPSRRDIEVIFEEAM